MSIFGKLDAAVISTNPFKIDEGDYDGEIVDAEFGTGRDGETRQLVIEYTITTEESSFEGQTVKEFFPLVPEDFDNSSMAMLPPSEQQKIRQNLANLKKRLCGYSEKNKGLGINEDDLNSADWNPVVLKGLPVRLGINNGRDGQYTNVKYAVLAD
jgi:hypothetical protein